VDLKVTTLDSTVNVLWANGTFNSCLRAFEIASQYLQNS
jgi:hypothetical protein